MLARLYDARIGPRVQVQLANRRWVLHSTLCTSTDTFLEKAHSRGSLEPCRCENSSSGRKSPRNLYPWYSTGWHAQLHLQSDRDHSHHISTVCELEAIGGVALFRLWIQGFQGCIGNGAAVLL